MPQNKYTVTERRILSILEKYGYCWDNRQILLGVSDTAAAWTDGSTYICLDRIWLRNMSLTYGQHINRLLMTMAHEMAHDEDSRGTHIHGPEFYEKMIRILESDKSPTIHAGGFKYQIERSKINERQLKERQKREKEEAKVDSKLGIAAKSK